MIGSLRGILLGISVQENPQVLIEVEGLGYRVSVGKSAIAQLGDEGSEIFIYTSHQVREDSETLYGFLDLKDRDAFEILIKIHKVGPSLAKDILDSYDIKELQDIVMRQDAGALTDIKGVGKATAERLLTELKNKLDIEDVFPSHDAEATGMSDIRKALAGLGYSNSEIRSVLQELPADMEAEDLLKQSLALLGPPPGK